MQKWTINAMLTTLLWSLIITLGSSGPGWAGVLTRADLIKRFPSPLIVSEKQTDIPVWPVFRQNATENSLVGYVFESVDMAPIPGFGGIPINLLIALDPKGTFLSVSVISQHEPVFVDGLGPAPMIQFVNQYQGLSINQNIRIGEHTRDQTTAAHASIDGVTKATASVRIINQSILSSALKVARKKLGFAASRDPDLIARINPTVLDTASISQLLDQGLIQHLQLRNRDVEKRFAGTDGAGLDQEAKEHPEAVFLDLYLAYASIPSVGHTLLRPISWTRLQNRLEPGDHAMIAFTLPDSRYSLTGDEFVRGSIPTRIVLRQDKLPIDMRDLDMDLSLQPNALIPPDATVQAFRIISQAGLDPAQTLDFVLPITRTKGMIYPERFTQEIRIPLKVPERYYIAAESDNKSWQGIWQSRWKELACLILGLGVLAAALTQQKRLTSQDRRFVWFRRAYLAFTLFFIGWYAQGQLSIVNLTGLIKALVDKRSLTFFLYDPMTVILWAFVLVTLVVWGRGTFCGWLCPFGALQEFIGKLAKICRIPQIKIRSGINAKLKWMKYLVLASILVSIFFPGDATDAMVEAEPFKTAITLSFHRSWPFLTYAIGLLLASSMVYKFFCRFICPFGAGLAALGLVRIVDWLPRRKQCGTPCQTCRHSCDYQAIKPTGAIDYAECFQCMDCVVIYESDQKCAPLIFDKKMAQRKRQGDASDTVQGTGRSVISIMAAEVAVTTAATASTLTSTSHQG